MSSFVFIVVRKIKWCRNKREIGVQSYLMIVLVMLEVVVLSKICMPGSYIFSFLLLATLLGTGKDLMEKKKGRHEVNMVNHIFLTL